MAQLRAVETRRRRAGQRRDYSPLRPRARVVDHEPPRTARTWGLPVFKPALNTDPLPKFTPHTKPELSALVVDDG